MSVLSGTVVAGKIVVNGRAPADGTAVYVVAPEPDVEVLLAVDELAELEAGIQEAERGETIAEEELIARLRRFG